MKTLERKLPPVVLFALFIVASTLCQRGLVDLAVTLPFPVIIAGLLVIASGYIGTSGVLEFRKAKTTVNPIKVDSARTVVESGVFGFTRNPMYLALLLLLLAYGYWLQNIAALVLPLGFVLYMNRFQIKPEERALSERFGEQYIRYKTRVRRWI